MVASFAITLLLFYLSNTGRGLSDFWAFTYVHNFVEWSTTNEEKYMSGSTLVSQLVRKTATVVAGAAMLLASMLGVAGIASATTIPGINNPPVAPVWTANNAVTGASTSAVPGNAKVTLTWTNSVTTTNGSAAVAYNVYMGTTAGGESAIPVNGSVPVPQATTTTSLVVSGLTNGTTYYFTVKAIDANGNASAASVENSATPAAAPSAPQNVVVAGGTGSATLTWSAPASDGASAVLGYNVYVSSTTPTYNAVTGLPTAGLVYDLQGGVVQDAGTTKLFPDRSDSVCSNATPPKNGAECTTLNTFSSANLITGTSYTVTGLDTSGNTSYWFVVTAVNAVGESSPVIATNTPTLPVAVTAAPSVTAADVAATSSVTLTWAGVTGSTGYNVYLGTTAGGESATALNANPIGTTADGSGNVNYTVTGLAPNTAYFFLVGSINGGGVKKSTEVSIVSGSNRPAAPTGVTAAPGNTTLTVSWTNGDDGGSAITSNTAAAYNAVTGAAAGTNCTDYVTYGYCVITGLTNGASYIVKVIATNANGASLTSGTSGVATPNYSKPSDPKYPAVSITGNTATITWTAPSATGGYDISGYNVLVGTSATSLTINSTVQAGVNTATISNLVSGTTYYFQVQAINALGAGSLSSAVFATVGGTAPGAASGLAVTAYQSGSNSQVYLTWTAPTSNGNASPTAYNIWAMDNSVAGAWTNVTSTSLEFGNSAIVTGLTAGHSYSFYVTTTNAQNASVSRTTGVITAGTQGATNLSGPSLTATGYAPAISGAVTNVSATPGVSTVTLNWSAPINADGTKATGYNIFTTASNPLVGVGAPSNSITIAGTDVTGVQATGQALTLADATCSAEGLNTTDTFQLSTASALIGATAGFTPATATGLVTFKCSVVSSLATLTLQGTGAALNAAVTGKALVVYDTNPSTTYAASGTKQIVYASEPAGLSTTVAGATVTGTNVPANTYVVAVNSLTNDAGSAIAINTAKTGIINATTGATTTTTAGNYCSVLGLNTTDTFQVDPTGTVAAFTAGTNGAITFTCTNSATTPVAGTTYATLTFTGSSAIASTLAGVAFNVYDISTTVDYLDSNYGTLGRVVLPLNSVLLNNTLTGSATSIMSTNPLALCTSSAATPCIISQSGTSAVISTGSITAKTFTVVATNDPGLGGLVLWSNNNGVATSGSTTTLTALTATTISVVASGSGYAVVADSGSGNYSAYRSSWTATAAPGGMSCTATTETTCTILGLTNGTTYSITATYAVTGAGTSPASAAVLALPVGKSAAPTAVTASTVNTDSTHATATISWTAPASLNGNTFAAYAVTATDLTTQTSNTYTVAAVPATASTAMSCFAPVTALQAGTTVVLGTTTCTIAGLSTAGTLNTPTDATTTAQPIVPGHTYVFSVSVVTTKAITGTSASKAGSTYTFATANPLGVAAGMVATGTGVSSTVADNAVVSTTPITVVMAGAQGTSSSGVALTFTGTYTATSAASTPVAPPALGGVPSKPLGVTATPGSSSVTISGITAPASNGGSAVLGYQLFQGTTPGGEGSTPVTGVQLLQTTGTYLITGLTNGTKYYFTVKAVTALGVGAASTEVSATPVGAPTTPTALVATSASATSVNLTWVAPASNGGSAVKGYLVYLVVDGDTTGGTGLPVNASAPTTTTSYTVTGLNTGVKYDFVVVAQTAGAYSAPSNVTTATPAAVAAVAVVALPKNVTVSFSASPAAKSAAQIKKMTAAQKAAYNKAVAAATKISAEGLIALNNYALNSVDGSKVTITANGSTAAIAQARANAIANYLVQSGAALHYNIVTAVGTGLDTAVMVTTAA